MHTTLGRPLQIVLRMAADTPHMFDVSGLLRDAADNLDELSLPMAAQERTPLQFEFDGEGVWTANSALNDDGSHFAWRVQVCEDGSFDVSSSDSELVQDGAPTFETFQHARDYCEEHEHQMLMSMLKEKS